MVMAYPVPDPFKCAASWFAQLGSINSKTCDRKIDQMHHKSWASKAGAEDLTEWLNACSAHAFAFGVEVAKAKATVQ